MEDPSITCPGEPLFGGEAGKVTAVMFKGLVRLWRLFRYLPKSFSLPLAKRLIGDAPPEEIEPWLESKRRASDDFILAIEDPGWLVGKFNFGLVETIKATGMLIYGDRDQGAIVSHAMAEELKCRIEHLRIVHLEGATHDIRRTRYDGYIRALSRFLKEING
jgi:pimeloyl-ACP methyl ester carboxylesterase